MDGQKWCYEQTGEITTSPKEGDGKYDHTGLFVKMIDRNQFESIEGNTSVGNNSNGGQVMRRTRQLKGALFVHPKVLADN